MIKNDSTTTLYKPARDAYIAAGAPIVLLERANGERRGQATDVGAALKSCLGKVWTKAPAS